MVLLRTLLFAISLTPALGTQVQAPGLQLPPGADESRAQVKEIFVNAFSAYKEFAFGHDDLAPVSKGFIDSRNGWGATVVDALDTMKIMGLEDLFQAGLAFVSQIDFSQSKTPDTVSIFESTIRYLGAMLSAYELNGNQPQMLIDQAKRLADKLSLGFNGDSPIPYGFVDFSVDKPVIQGTNIAEAGTLTVEWSRLSKYTGNDTYRRLTEDSSRHIASLTPPLPGLAAQSISPTTGKFLGGYVSWGGGSDSYFEYLLKYTRLNPDADPLLLETWKTAVDSSIKWLHKVSTVGNFHYLADFTSNRRIRHIGSHLECFVAGNWILGGQLLRNQTIVDIGLELADSCWNTYASTATGIGPEVFAYMSDINGQPPNGTDDGIFAGAPITADDMAFFNQHGFYIYNGFSFYILRPEVLESNFYAWRVTGNPKYIRNAQHAVESIRKFLVVPGGDGGVSGLFDVNNATVTADSRVDDTESFFFAEVMKYLYLTLDDPDHISIDEFVFNTESHPFKAPPLEGEFAPKQTLSPAAAATVATSFNPEKMVDVPPPQISFSPKLHKQLNDGLGL